MDDGKIIADGTPKEVFAQIELLKRRGTDSPADDTASRRAESGRVQQLPLDALTMEECAQALCRWASA